MRYFLNYVGKAFERFSCGLLSEDGTKSALVVPMLDLEKAKKSSSDQVFSWTDTEGYEGALRSAVKFLNSKTRRIGIEETITFGKIEQFKSVLGACEFLPISIEASNLRLIKTEEEIKSTKDAARKLGRVYKSLPEIIRKGKTESEIGLEIVKLMYDQKLEPDEPPLIQSGPNSAIPHSTISQRVLRKGDMIVVDSSCPNGDGYYADFTRAFVLGKPNEKQKEVYEIVKSAEAAGVEESASGKSAQEVDRKTRSIIAKAGYGKYFFHRTGHGLGLEVHEAPYIKEGNSNNLENGMVFTIEPGIYLPGKFGVRIEDNVVIEKGKAKNLTTLSHELIEI